MTSDTWQLANGMNIQVSKLPDRTCGETEVFMVIPLKHSVSLLFSFILYLSPNTYWIYFLSHNLLRQYYHEHKYYSYFPLRQSQLPVIFFSFLFFIMWLLKFVLSTYLSAGSSACPCFIKELKTQKTSRSHQLLNSLLYGCRLMILGHNRISTGLTTSVNPWASITRWCCLPLVLLTIYFCHLSFLFHDGLWAFRLMGYVTDVPFVVEHSKNTSLQLAQYRSSFFTFCYVWRFMLENSK